MHVIERARRIVRHHAAFQLFVLIILLTRRALATLALPLFLPHVCCSEYEELNGPSNPDILKRLEAAYG
jgi:hypothetical protein